METNFDEDVGLAVKIVLLIVLIFVFISIAIMLKLAWYIETGNDQLARVLSGTNKCTLTRI